MQTNSSAMARTISPSIPCRPTADGFVIRALPDRQTPLLLFIGAATAAASILIISSHDFPKHLSTIAYIVSISLIGLFIAWNLFYYLSFAPPTITASIWPLCLGTPIRMRFTRKGRGVSIDQVCATLKCVEQVRYDVGTSTNTVSQIVWQQQLPSAQLPPNTHSAEANWIIIIPLDLPPSFVASSNTINWQLIVTTHNDTFRHIQSTFDLHVKPEVAKL